MIVLDTNVLSELMRPNAEPRVAAWLGRFATDELHVTAVTQAEILAGVTCLPQGRRRHGLERAAIGMFEEQFAGRVLPLDGPAARVYADILAVRRRAGRPAKPLDTMIAAIAFVHGAAVATRNVGDFDLCGIVVHDPWAV